MNNIINLSDAFLLGDEIAVAQENAAEAPDGPGAPAPRAAAPQSTAKAPSEAARNTRPALRKSNDIQSELWQIYQQKGVSATEKYRQSGFAVVNWLLTKGKLYHTEEKSFDSVMFFDNMRKLLLPVRSDAFQSWLASMLGINRSEQVFKFAQSAVETAGLGDRSVQVELSYFWAAKNGNIFLSNGPGHIVKISRGKVEMVDNGADDVLFRQTDTLRPWKLVEPENPFDTCSLFSNMSTIAPHGKLLFMLWVISLPSNQKTKPPLCLSGDAGSGKTRTAVGVFELFGIPKRIANLKERDGESDFWAAINGGGLCCFDNCDSKNSWFPDSLSAAATGGTQEKRQLYSDAERFSMQARSWISITSASPSFASDVGLSDRLLNLRLKRRTGETAEDVLSSEIEKNRDAGLSWIVHTLSAALADTSVVPGGLNQRHPDFAGLAVRLGRALNKEDETIAALHAAEVDKALFSIENDTIGAALLDLLQTESFTGTATELQEKLVVRDSTLEGKLSVKRLGKRVSKLWVHLQTVFNAKIEKDPHTKSTVYIFADFAGFKTAFPQTPHENSFLDTLVETPHETPQTPQEPRLEW